MRKSTIALVLVFVMNSPALSNTDSYLREIADNQQTIISLLKKMLNELEDIQYNTL